MKTPIAQYWKNYIDGNFVDGGAGRLRVDNPATGEVLAYQALADAADVHRAVTAAKACHDSKVLTDLRPVERGRMVAAIGEYLLRHKTEIAPLLTLESGPPLWEAEMEVEGAARYFEYYGNQAQTLEGKSIPLGASYFDFTVLEPYGVCAQIIPWNYPLEMAARSMSAALATGNTCVIKTPELDPLSSYYLAMAAQEAGFPAGAVNIICGLGSDAGAALASHPDVNQIVFTGSVATGIQIATAAAANVVPCVLELGGKSAAIVYEDADLERLLADVRWGIFFNAGQVCSAMSRLLVHRSIYPIVLEQLQALASSLSVGPGIERTEFGPNMGAMISSKQRDRALAMCEAAQSHGARTLCGAKAIGDTGFFHAPTVLADVSPIMGIAQNEAFAPVLSVMPFEKESEAIAIANGTAYGLVGGVYTRDIDRAMHVARQMRAGQVFINEWFAGGVETPFGGFGKSGYGREKGREALLNYVQTKNIAIATTAKV
ncbi:MAG: aldehyde dehydrogenase family protein [Pseudomonadota bacterium]